MTAGHTEDAATHMDRMYRGQRHIYDLTRKYYLLGRDRLIADLQPPAGGTVLELGCGTGRNLIAVAKRYPDAQLYGIDISNEMLITARANADKAGLSGRIQFAQGDASSVDTGKALGIAAFDRVFVSYALSMIPPWRETAAHALSLIKPGGRLAIVDFGQQAQLPGWFRAGLQGWLAKFSVEPRAGLQAELTELAQTIGVSMTWTSLYRDYAHYATITRPSH
jgi:S-adenosylmethionine-diacylgycerolhomoserine-N-methlytransferase